LGCVFFQTSVIVSDLTLVFFNTLTTGNAHYVSEHFKFSNNAFLEKEMLYIHQVKLSFAF